MKSLQISSQNSMSYLCALLKSPKEMALPLQTTGLRYVLTAKTIIHITKLKICPGKETFYCHHRFICQFQHMLELVSSKWCVPGLGYILQDRKPSTSRTASRCLFSGLHIRSNHFWAHERVSRSKSLLAVLVFNLYNFNPSMRARPELAISTRC